ncbi:MAG: DUF1285 domain-containing protein [Sphingomonadaceae bacterium]|nr:DUF1285 domain-containing protein [Sphingomonadaceae bacterium]
MPYDAPNLAGLNLAEIADLAAARKLPPVESWQPTQVGDSEMRIAADGKWYHQGGEITRPAMIRAFSGLLRRDPGGSHWLVTPQQKLSIEVEDAPFVAVELRTAGSGRDRELAFRLNSDDLVIAGPENPIELRRDVPYLHVRGGLWAKLARPVYYELAEMALAGNTEHPSVWSKGIEFSIGNPE